MTILPIIRRAPLALAAAALLVPSGPAAAQRILKDAASDLEHGLRDVVHVWTAPLHMSTRDLEGLAVVAGVGGGLMLADREIQDWVDANPSSVVIDALHPFREEEPLEAIGDIWYTVRYASAVWLVGLAFDSPTIREASMGCLAASVAQTIPRRLVLYKGIARTRPRFTGDPYDFAVPGEDDWARRSFPSGHAANAFTCISYLNTRYSLGVLEPVLYAAATGAALARVPDQAHWASDIWLGIALGYAVGRGIALNARPDDERSDATSRENDSSAIIDPADLDFGWTPEGLRLSYTRRF